MKENHVAILVERTVGGAHLPFPGIGHVRRGTVGYEWVPVEFGPIREDLLAPQR